MRVLKIFSAVSLLALQGVAADCKPMNPLIGNNTLIYRLWTSSCDLVGAFLDNAFIKNQAAANQGSSIDPKALASLRYYFLQDYYYLWALVSNKAELIAKAAFPNEKDRIQYINATFNSMSGDVAYAQEFRAQIINDLGVTTAEIDEGNPNQTLVGYLAWLSKNTEYGRFLYDVSTIACIFGWAELAYRVNQTNPNLNKASPFYTLWVEGNADYSYGQDLSNRLQANAALANDNAAFATYQALFRQGLQYETLFFDSALGQVIGPQKC